MATIIRASTHPTKAPAGMPRVTGEVFGKLINLSGRRRFTSQRVVLFAVLAAQGRVEALQASKDALATFVEAHTALVQGNADLPGVFCDELQQAYFGAGTGTGGTGGGDAVIGQFVDLARRAHEAIEARMRLAPALVDQLVDSATPLLGALNGITQVYEDLARRHATRSRKQFLDMMGDIQSIAKEARIVSFNAQVVAARPQVSGREFSVVANELSHITSRIDELVREAVGTSVA